MPIQIKTIPPNILDLLCSKQPNFFPKKTPMRQRINVMTEMAEMDDVTACDSLNYLCRYLEHAYGKK